MSISLVVAAAENNAIGKGNQLLWNLPNDMRFFKNITWGMPVIMGRKTFESFNKILPGRFMQAIPSFYAIFLTSDRNKRGNPAEENKHIRWSTPVQC